jgi:CHAT domain-containing protein
LIGLHFYFQSDPKWGSPPFVDLGEVHLELADHYKRLEQWSDEEEQIRQSMISFGGTDHSYGSSKYELYVVRPLAMLAENLNNQKRFKEAEAVLVSLGDLTAVRTYSGSNPQVEFAVAVEGQGRLADAESMWRSLGLKDRLLANLKRQGKKSEAADLLAEIDNDEQAADDKNPLTTAELIEQRDLMLALAESQGPKDGKYARKAADELEKRIAVAQRQGEAGSSTPHNVANVSSFELAEFSNALGPLPNDMQLHRATLLFEAERFAEAADLFAENCPKTLRVSSYGPESLPPSMKARLSELSRKLLPDPLQSDDILGNSFPSQVCFQRLAISQKNMAKKASGTFTEDEFSSAQNAIVSAASLALTRAGARRFASSIGILPELDGIERMTRDFMSSKPVDELFSKLERFADLTNNPSSMMEMPKVGMEMIEASNAVLPLQLDIQKRKQALEARSPEYFSLLNPMPVSLTSLQAVTGTDSKLLHGDEALVLWMMGPGNSRGLVYAISKSGSARAEIGLTTNEIEELVAKLRRQIDPCDFGPPGSACRKQDENSFDRKSAWELYNALLGAPAIQAVVGDSSISKLIIVPSGALTALPPGLLITEEPEGGAEGDRDPGRMAAENWLITKKAIAVLPGVSALRSLRQDHLPSNSTASSGLYMFANPNFSGATGKQLSCRPGQRAAPNLTTVSSKTRAGFRSALASLNHLPCTLEEGLAIKEIVGGDLFTDLDASEARLRNEREKVANAGVIAFATHGLVTGDFGLGEPALALAQPRTGEPDDGFLTASEVLGLRLNADWVILSACNTASPESAGADGLSGLSRAFFYAGAKSLLASHWRVDDLTTRLLIAETLKLHLTGLSKAESLQKASLQLMRGELEVTDGSQAFPSAWAPFTVIGDPN